MYKIYSAFNTTFVIILFLCSTLGDKLLAQSGSIADYQFKYALKALNSADHLLAAQKFQRIIDDFCHLNEYSELCFEAKLYKSRIARTLNNLDEAGIMLADLKDFVFTNLNADINKLVYVYTHKVFLAYQQSDLETSQKWATKLREITINSEVETLPMAWSYLALGHHESMAGNYQEAISNYQKGIERANIINDLEKTGEVLIAIHNNLGIPYRILGEPVKAKNHFQKSLEVIRK